MVLEMKHNSGTASLKHTPTIDQSMSNSAIYGRLGMEDSLAAATSAICCQLSQTNLRNVGYCISTNSTIARPIINGRHQQ
jgi:hypothetical protein